MPFQIEKLINPRSIAIVGASVREDALGTVVLRNLLKLGFDGAIYPVNPKYPEVSGLRCYPTLSDIPEPADAAFIGVPAAAGPDVLDQAARRGIKAAEINAMGYGDGGAEGTALQARIQATAAAHGMAVCGPNNVGLMNVYGRSALWTIPVDEVRPGPVAILAQSGSAGLVLSQDSKRLGLAYAITSGNEAVVTAADYLEYLVADDRVELILLFLETIRNPKKFGAVASRAARSGKHIVAVKVGRSDIGQAAVEAHSNSIAGSDDVYDAFFREHGIVRVQDFDEMLETAAVFSAYPSPPPTRHVVPITLSGGEGALVADLAATAGVSIRPLQPTTVERLRPNLPPFVTPRNPLDAWGLSWETQRFQAMVEALIADDEIGVIVPAVDAPESGQGDAGIAREIARVLVKLAPTSPKKFLMFNNSAAGGTDPELVALLAEAGIPCLSGMSPALAAIAHWANFQTPAPESRASNDGRSSPWRAPLADPGSLTEVERYGLLRQAGIPMVDCRAVASAAEAVREARALGYPVALKGSAPGVAHKTELGLVRLDLDGPKAVRNAFADVKRKLAAIGHKGAEITVQPQVAGGLELIVGVRNDPAFGPITIVGLGGVHVELLRQASIRLGQVDRNTAQEMFEETLAGRLLAGVRGQPPFDAEAAAEAVAAASRLGCAMEGVLAAFEINPLIVLEKGRGAVAVDALLEPSTSPRP
ncbi:MAG TPA: acetate--CoA ligase family protein [Candidatus Dormibacteraeota bacterium]